MCSQWSPLSSRTDVYAEIVWGISAALINVVAKLYPITHAAAASTTTVKINGNAGVNSMLNVKRHHYLTMSLEQQLHAISNAVRN